MELVTLEVCILTLHARVIPVKSIRSDYNNGDLLAQCWKTYIAPPRAVGNCSTYEMDNCTSYGMDNSTIYGMNNSTTYGWNLTECTDYHDN